MTVFSYSASERLLSPSHGDSIGSQPSSQEKVDLFFYQLLVHTRAAHDIYETREAGSKLIPKYLQSLLQLRPNLDEKKKIVAARVETWLGHETSTSTNSHKALESFNYSMNLSMSQFM